jgi:hypothetical protein
LSASKPNKSGCTFIKASLSFFPASSQEEKDFKLALQLQHKEMHSPACVWVQIVETQQTPMNPYILNLKQMQLQHYCNYSENGKKVLNIHHGLYR